MEQDAGHGCSPGVAGRVGIIALTSITPIAWGTTYAVTTEFLPPGRPLLAATLRALPAGLLLIALTRRLPQGAWWWKAALLGVLNIGAFFSLLFASAYRLPGGVAATLGAVQPLFVVFLAWALLGQGPRARQLLAGALGVAGVALMVLTASARLDAIGIAAGVLGTLSMGTGIVLTRRWGRPVPLLAFTGWQLTAGGLAVLPLALAAEGLPSAVTPVNVGGYLWLGIVGTLLAYTLWFNGIARLSAQSVTFLALLSPVVALVVGWLWLGQSLGPAQVVGAVVALVAIVLGQGETPARRAAPVAPDERVPVLP